MPPDPPRTSGAGGPRRFAPNEPIAQILPRLASENLAPPTAPRPAPIDLPRLPPTRHAQRRSPQKHRGRALGRVVVAATSVAVLVATGLAWGEVRLVGGGFHTSNVLVGQPVSPGSAENILLIGLDTRKDRNGNNLPPDVLAQLHAGDGDEGGYNTNTLILIHIPADGRNIVAFSIPRDDYVAVDGIDGYDHAKIKEAYGLMKAQTEQQLVNRGVSDPVELEQEGRDAGRAETLATVRQLTGVAIDRFAEVSLVGFYDIAKALGGVRVCLNHAVSDDYSGARFSAGVHTLNAAQSLAFVRQRHGLDNGDLDRTHRQQAFLVSVTQSLQTSGVFGDVSKLNALVSVAQRDVTLSAGWDIIDYAHRIGDIAGQSTRFTTLPVLRYDTVDGEDVNIIDPAAIRAQVQTAFGLKPATAPNALASAKGLAAATTPDATDDPAPDQGPPVSSSASGVPCVN